MREQAHEIAVADVHRQLMRRANELGLSVALEEAAEAIVEGTYAADEGREVEGVEARGDQRGHSRAQSLEDEGRPLEERGPERARAQRRHRHEDGLRAKPQVIIRPATEADRDAIVAMGAHFIAGTHYGDIFEQLVPGADLELGIDRLLTLAWALGPEGAMCLVAEDSSGLVGMLGAACGPHLLTGEKFTEEVCWWVELGARGFDVGPQLLEAIERWAGSVGCAFIAMIEPLNAPAVGRFYRQHGYFKVETKHAKRLR